MTSEKGKKPESPTIGQITFELWRKLRMTTIFSNPGSTEVPLLRHMPGDFNFVLGLHEASVVGMATGYALATKIPALALLHTTAGLGNAVGAIATARVNKAPLVITIGQQDRRHLINNPFLAGELKDLAGKYPLSVYEPILARDVPTLMARAWQQARSRNGPALVIVPMDDWDYLSDDPLLATPLEIEPARIQTEQGVEKLIQMISNSSTPALVVGADADDPDSWRSLTELADKLNSPVFQEAFGARAGFPQDHPLFAGHLPSGRAKLREVLSGYDLILAVGAPSFRQYPFEDGPFVQRGTKIAVVGDDISVLQSSTADLAVLGTISDICFQVAQEIETRFGLPPKISKAAKPKIHQRLRAANVYDSLSSRVPPEAIIVEESPSSKPELHRRIHVRQSMGFLSAAMGGLGFAMPAAIGLRMGCDRPVIAIVGDGSSQYSIQSIWSAVEYQVGVLFIIMNNGSYSIMDRLSEMQSYSRKVWPPLGHIDISKLAQGYGCDSLRIENQSQLDDTLTSLIPKLSSLSSPVLLDVQVESDPTFEP